MRSAHPISVAIVVCLSICGVAAQSAKPAPASKGATTAASKPTVPAAVAAAFKKTYPNATITTVSKEDGNYEVESMDGTQRRDLIYKPDGTVVECEEFIDTKDVPEAVLTAIKTRFPKATVGQCEKLFKDKTMNYEAALKGAGKVTEVILTPAGKWIEPK